MTVKNLLTATFLVMLGVLGVIIAVSPDADSKSKHGGASAKHKENQTADEWTCPMHPSVREPEPGNCPICEMKLVPARSGSEFSATEVSRAKIRTTAAKRKFVTRNLSIYGKVEVDQTRTTTTTAWVSGRIEKLYRDHRGRNIRKGEDMLELYSPELRATHRELIGARKRWEAATSPSAKQRIERDLSSIRSRLRQWGIPEQKIDELEQQEKPSNTITLTAPQHGVIQKIHRKEGEWVKRGDPVYSLVDLDRVWITLFPYESEVSSLRIGQEAHLQVDAFPGETFEGRIGFINQFVDESTHTIETHIHADNPAGKLKPGMYADAHVEIRLSKSGRPVKPEGMGEYICKHHPHADTRTKTVDGEENKVCAVDGMELTHFSEFGYVSQKEAEPPLVIPKTAPLLTGKRAIVYVLNSKRSGNDPGSGEGPHSYELREVQLGPETDRYYIVEDGLEEGEQVVYQGAFKIDSELQIRGEPSMMYPEPDKKPKSGGHQH